MIDRPIFKVLYEGKDISEDISAELIEIGYTDFLEGQSDEVLLVVCDFNKKWITSWYPQQNAKLSLSLGYESVGLVDLGSFEIDEISYRYPSAQVSIKALAVGLSKSSRTRQPKAYEDMTLKQVVNQVAQRLNMKVVGDLKEVHIARLTQYQESDLEFLVRLSKQYGYAFKVVDQSLVFTYKESFKKEQGSRLDLERVISMEFKDKVSLTKKKVIVSSFDEQKKLVITSEKEGQKINQGALSENTHKVVLPVADQAQADAVAQGELYGENEAQTSVFIELLGEPSYVAGGVIEIKHYGVFDGHYLIKESNHSLSRSGFRTRLELVLLKKE